MEPAASRGRHPVAAPQESRVPEDQFRWHHTFSEHTLRAVDVGEQSVEHPRPLVDPDLERRPVGTVDDQRNRVEDPRPLLAGCLVLHRVGHAIVADQPPCLFPAIGELGGLPRSELPHEAVPVGPRCPVGATEFVIRRLGRPVARKRVAGSRTGGSGGWRGHGAVRGWGSPSLPRRTPIGGHEAATTRAPAGFLRP